MIYRGYPEHDLVSNRSSLLLYGGSEADRRAWAEEAAQNFDGEGMRVVHSEADLGAALGSSRGVVFIPEVGALGMAAQGELLRVLKSWGDRPKVVVGSALPPVVAREHGRLRSDLEYALQMAQVNLDDEALREAIRVRRANAPRRPEPAPAPAKTTPAKTTRAKARRTNARAPARKPAAKARKASASKPKSKARPARKPAAKKSSAKKGATRRRR